MAGWVWPAGVRPGGVAAVVGGVLVHLTLGNLYSFGNMMTYMVSFMHLRVDESVTYSNFLWVNSITTATQGLCMVVGGVMERRIGPRLTCFIGCTLLSAGIMLTRYSIETSLWAVMLTYGFLAGLGISLAYVTPLACGMEWFPAKKGLINGVIVAGFGLGALGSTNFQTQYLNPDNLPPEANGYFTDPALLDRVPGLFVTLGLIFLAMQYVGCLLISKPAKVECCSVPEGDRLLSEEEDPEHTQTPTDPPDVEPKAVVKTRLFYTFWSIYLCNTIAVGYINATYKSFGQTFIADDHFLAVVGSLASVFNASGRVFWGHLMDRTSFRASMRFLAVSLSLLFASLPLTAHLGKFAFTIWVWLIFFTFSGNFVLMPTVTQKSFGSKYYSANYGLLFTSQTVSGPLIAAVNQAMLAAVGYTGCFLVIALVLLISAALTFVVPRRL